MAIYDMITLGKKVENVKSIFITHLHGDHSNGLFSFIDLINWYYKLSNPSIIIPNINAEKIFDEWLNMTKTKSKRQLQTLRLKAVAYLYLINLC